MINNFLEEQIKENFLYQPTDEQEIAVKSLSAFLLSTSEDAVFLLRGYAGTGKTSLIGALVKAMDSLKQKSVLLAPTGRASKVFSLYAGHSAFTIHKKIYRQKSFSNELTNFSLNENLHTHTLFIVDEASMISNQGLSGNVFGTGRLLDDLVHYVYSGTGCRMLVMGDTAQLPPVGENETPALMPDILKGYGLEVYEVILTKVVRQLNDSGILWNATHLRQIISSGKEITIPKIKLKGFADIRSVRGDELIDEISSCYDKAGIEDTIVICRSNKRANLYNEGIRNTILYREEELSSGDILMIAKNNYFWAEKEKEMDFIANGDIAVVRRFRKEIKLYGFRFAEVLLSFPDYNDHEIDALLMMDTLRSDSSALPKDKNDKLFYSILEDYAELNNKREIMKKIKENPYYNAMQVKYAYAVTAHKAQGGQWKKVFLDQGYVTAENLTEDYLKWLYTAFTRATETLYLINYPTDQVD